LDKKQYLFHILGGTTADQFLSAVAEKEKEAQTIFAPDSNHFGIEIVALRCAYCGTKHNESDFLCQRCGAPL